MDKIKKFKTGKNVTRKGLWELGLKLELTCHVCIQIRKENRKQAKRPRGFARSIKRTNVKKRDLDKKKVEREREREREKETSQLKRPFLDMDIKNQTGQIITDIYHKTINGTRLLI